MALTTNRHVALFIGENSVSPFLWPEIKKNAFANEMCSFSNELCGNTKIGPDKPAFDSLLRDHRSGYGFLAQEGRRMRLHDLRHAVASRLAEGQTSDQTIMALSGHMSRKMIQRIPAFGTKQSACQWRGSRWA